jgi:hypothetical protein
LHSLLAQSALPLVFPSTSSECVEKAGQILSAGGVSLNGAKLNDPKATLDETRLIDGHLAVLRVGKGGNLIVHVDDEAGDKDDGSDLGVADVVFPILAPLLMYLD